MSQLLYQKQSTAQPVTQPINRVVIVGGGSAGWISAALLAKVLGRKLDVVLVESEQIGTVGVGEASIPPMVAFNQALGIDEQAFAKATQATLKLGIEFQGWGQSDSCYMHAFGQMGKNFPFCEFYQFWLYGRQQGLKSDFWDFSLNYQLAKQHRFSALKCIPGTDIPGTAYAYHFDASLYANFLNEYAQKWGVTRIEGRIEHVHQDPITGLISAVELDDKQKVAGDLFIDCSGMRALLIEQALASGFEDWSHWLPCDTAWAVASEAIKESPPYTVSRAHGAGWQWQIPLQHRTGNGWVFASRFMDAEQARQDLIAQLPTAAIAEPRKIAFKTGCRRSAWKGNVVAIGLSAGFLEPLESTSIHLIQTAIIRLIKFFPHQGISAELVKSYNQLTQTEMERIRDFIILHYKLNQRNDSDFWRHCQRMSIPDSLANKIELYLSSAKLFRQDEELFTEQAWQQVLIGQGLLPDDVHPLATVLDRQQLQELFASLRTLITKAVDQAPSHQSYWQKQ